MKTRLIACLLCLTLLASLTACGDKPTQKDPTTSPTTASTPTETTTPTPTELEEYQAAVDTLLTAQNLTLTISEVSTATTGGESFDYECTHEIIYTGLGTDTFAAEVQQSVEYCGEDFQYTEQYADGIAFLTLEDGLYSQPMTADEFLDRFLPLALIDGTLYADISSKSDGSSTVYTFRQPTESEDWLAGMELTQAEATATEKGGQITGYTYDASYTAGGTTKETSLSVEITYEEATQPTPPDSALYTEIEDLSAPIYMYLAVLGMDAAESISATIENVLSSSASGELVTTASTMDLYGSGSELVFKQTFDFTPYDMLGIEKVGYSYEDVVIDGEGTLTQEGEEPYTYAAASSAMIHASVTDQLQTFLVDPSQLTAASMEVTGAGVVVRFTANEEAGARMEKQVAGDFFGDANLLTDLAENYVTESLEGYIALDLYSMLPTAYSIDFTGVHTLEGEQYPLTLQHTLSMDMASISAYYNVTGEHLPTQEPETPATPVFYKVTDDEGHALWLFGTIHVGDSRTAYLPQEIWDAFDAADALAVEFDDDAFMEEIENDPDLQTLISEAYVYADGSTIQAHLTHDEELYDYAVAAMQASGSYAYYFDSMKPFIWSNTLENFHLRQGHRLTSEQGMDNRLIDRAREQEKEILDVESGEMQLQMLSNYSDNVQEYMLASAVYTTQDAYVKGVQELYEMWCRGDEAELAAYLSEEDDTSEMTEEELAIYEEYTQAMMTNRNIDMLKVAQDYLASGDTVFYAVGLAHLLGVDGLVDALRNAGYTVELVTYAQ